MLQVYEKLWFLAFKILFS